MFLQISNTRIFILQRSLFAVFLVSFVTLSLGGTTSETRQVDGGSCDCGMKGRQDVKIVGGVLSKKNAWPWVAAIVQTSESRGHCIDYFTHRGLKQFRVILGTNDLNDETALSVKIASAIAHPRFDSTTLENDVGLVELETPLEYSQSVSPICITPQVGVPFIDRNAVVAGWGSTYFGGNTTTMQMQTMVDVISNSECQSRYNETTVTNTMLCARRSNKDSCQGDSGGALFLLRDEQADSYLQIGIVSFGKGCADSNYPGIYSRLSRFTSWIRRTIGNDDLCRSS